ncbi:hypothetical protein MBLNU457_6521t2 [Dothideomycetes sp. NU457]
MEDDTDNNLPNPTPPAQDEEESQCLVCQVEAARNNRLHQLPRELLYMIVDYLPKSKDISNLREALLEPIEHETEDVLGKLDALALRIELMNRALDRLEEFRRRFERLEGFVPAMEIERSSGRWSR